MDVKIVPKQASSWVFHMTLHVNQQGHHFQHQVTMGGFFPRGPWRIHARIEAL